MEDLSSSKEPASEPIATAGSLSRRELLKKAGWAVPAIVALPLMPGKAHGHLYASPGGGKSVSSASSASGSNDQAWARQQKKEKAAKALQKLLRKLFGRK